MKPIGIDFGTTKTMVAAFDPERRTANPITLGRGAFEMPTTIYTTVNGDILYGDDADDEGITDSLNHVRRFKMKLGRDGLAHVGRRPATAAGLTTDFLAHVRNRLANEAFHAAVERVVLTVPAMFGPAQRRDLSKAAEAAGFKEVELLHEPVAAGIAYCDHHSASPNANRFLVVDWGGGTFDVALLERDQSGDLRSHGDFETGLRDIGGEDLDDDLWNLASSNMDRSGLGRLDAQPKQEWGKYRRDLSRAKERLSTQSSVNCRFSITGGGYVKIELAKVDFELAIRPKVERGARFVNDLLVRCRNAGCSPDFILLAGGTSRIPLVGCIMRENTGLECRQWASGRESIALGAAIYANHLWGGRTSEAHSVRCAEQATRAHPQNPVTNAKMTAMAQYRQMLQTAWADRTISPDEMCFLGMERKGLGLTIEEATSLQIQVLGAPIVDLVTAGYPQAPVPDRPLAKLSPIRMTLEQSDVGLQIMAMSPDAHPDLQGEDYIRATHFPVTYGLVIENTQSARVSAVRLTLSSDGQTHSLLIPTIDPGEPGRLSLTTADLGWAITPGDVITADVLGYPASVFEVTDELCSHIDNGYALHEEIAVLVVVRKAAFSANFVLKILNRQSRPIRVSAFDSTAGHISNPIDIAPDAEAEIGWCELSGGRNLKANDDFRVSIVGFRTIVGVVAEGQLIGGKAAWGALAALGGIALAVAGG